MNCAMCRAAFAFVIVTLCVGQVGRSYEAGLGGNLQLIRRILLAGHVSGSIAYSGCGFDRRVPPDLPPFGVLDQSGPPQEVLKKLFSADPLMQVTQEEGGMIRMIETNVPTDLLNIKIHRLSFFPSDVPESAPVYGPRTALHVVLASPEVVAFGKSHNIGGLPLPNGRHIMPGDCCGGGRSVHGELKDVTVSQGLDYILQTFPGYWVYENCATAEGARSVYFNFD